ncbi:META domain-containing protein [Flavobacterium sp.]|jgi:heat shock protein HslJ|uniref:META domain-containing protein n=1 Tax=Flavobacterium sp. TaxID=239 RepID=UPI0037C17A3F
MKKFYFILGIAFLTIVSCKNQETSETDVINDTIVNQDSTMVVNETEVVDSTAVDSSDVDLLNKMSTSTTNSSTDPSEGKYALAETKWKLVELNGKAVKSATNKDYFINLDSKSGKFATYAGCNNFSGTFVMKAAKKLAFSKIAGTKMACLNMSFESNFITTIEKTDNYMIEDNVLHLHKGKAMLAKFESAK